uniref:T-cell-interacting, activating receptor on myeloid cells protein 1-like n=1 Tax=Monodelphis domestica TaxID=13616 RepID=H9H680_MONDO
MNMSPTVASLLWLGLCLAQIAAAGAQSLPSMASCPSSSSEQKGTSMAGTPKPFIRAEPGSVVPREAHVRFCCRSTWRSGSFQLWKDGGCSFQINASREQAEGCFPKSVAAAGNYSCRYSRGLHWSELSAPLQLLVTGHFSKPSLRGQPGTVVSAGDTVTLLCQASPTYHNPKMTFFLLKAGVPHPVQRLSPEGDVANFTLPSVKAEDAGSYSCICSVGERSSSPSDALHLEVTGGKDAHPPKPDVLLISDSFWPSFHSLLYLWVWLIFLNYEFNESSEKLLCREEQEEGRMLETGSLPYPPLGFFPNYTINSMCSKYLVDLRYQAGIVMASAGDTKRAREQPLPSRSSQSRRERAQESLLKMHD